MLTPREEIQNTDMGGPHVVILGAGASLAACPEGDKYGNPLPLMDNLVEILDLTTILNKYNIDYSSQNFEEIYSSLCENNTNSELAAFIENKVKAYFSKLTLPPHPTIYDHLLLSLRKKDIIATFNWDPLLYNACCRNYEKASLPHIVYLHGNVAIGYCLKDKMKGSIFAECSKCGVRFTPSKLLFPIKQKNYTKDPFISEEWQTLKNYLKHAYIFTIFGYSAPTSDVEAISMMKEAWGDPATRSLEEIEFIDIKSEDVLADTWKDFIHSHHYGAATHFYNSFIAKHPRRTCEAMWSCLMQLDPYRDNNVPIDFGFEELYKWYAPLLEAENIKKSLDK